MEAIIPPSPTSLTVSLLSPMKKHTHFYATNTREKMGVVGDTNCNESVGKERRDSLECAVYLPEWKQKGIEGEKKE